MNDSHSCARILVSSNQYRLRQITNLRHTFCDAENDNAFVTIEYLNIFDGNTLTN